MIDFFLIEDPGTATVGREPVGSRLLSELASARRLVGRSSGGSASAQGADSADEPVAEVRESSSLASCFAARIFHTGDLIRTGVTDLISDPERMPFMLRPGIVWKLKLRPILCGIQTTEYSRERSRPERAVGARAGS
jgi:hypothetical protein